MHEVTRVLTAHYDSCLATHGPTPEGMDWGSDATRLADRFGTICRAIGLDDGTAPVDILDVGCGCGLLLDHLRERHPDRATYTGVDASPAMIDAARERHPDATWLRADILDDPLPDADWVVANGLLTERRGIDERQMTDFAQAAVRRMYECCRAGIAFNVLSDHVNFRDPNLFYWGPAATLAFTVDELSRHVTIHHDLTTYDYFVCVRRHAWTVAHG
ncbi:MAG: class I SAM-dependent methyltransferase [Planctomycetes bacterium]|nr:class I SAM-dependent methyltransferase [Planctomycetota bacterium]